ncbi:MAG: hypothetical protein KJ949_00035 [Nanoarchaeota archaeon]|nr:hypothetical protein [Nanoarchaeota archaeon]MBU4308283.1 hypothetical protein [Nanoarchaeota archaeon]
MKRYFPFGGNFIKVVDSKNRIYFPESFRRCWYNVLNNSSEEFKLYPKNKYVKLLKNSKNKKAILNSTTKIFWKKMGELLFIN